MPDFKTERVRIWVGNFRSRRQYSNYFCPPTNNPHGPPAQFEEDQGVLIGPWTWSEFRDEGPTEDLAELLDGCDKADLFLEAVCAEFARSGIGPVNTVYVAFEDEIPNPKPVSTDRYELHVLGEFCFEVPYDHHEDDEEEEDDEDWVEVSADEISEETAALVAGRGPMDDDRFWGIIERAWEAVPDGYALRRQFYRHRTHDLAEELQFHYCRTVVALLEAALKTLSKRDLVEFDRRLEARLHELDRPDLHEQTGGSNDGFLYCRGFIVALGRRYFEKVCADPTKALSDVECEEICLSAMREYVDRYGEPIPPSQISRESFTNKNFWR